MASIPGPDYGIRTQVNLPFHEAVEKTRAALKEEGFGILMEADVARAMKEKIGVDFPNYVILGACNPPLAYKALQVEQELGILLPCNVIVYESDGRVVVSAMNPEVALAIVRNDGLRDVAAEAQARLQRAIASLQRQFGVQ